uniref:Uncharacterized protein n=1 Tax=viral metagenome TaxID=1070528 RepID=A0A6H1ZW19_9ZZZZ
MECKNCKKEIGQIEGKKAKFFCGNACRMAYNRAILKANKSEHPKANISNANTPKIKSEHLTAQDLYDAISSYPHGTWKDSPEYAELMKRLKTKSEEKLRKEGYWLPAWKLESIK